MHEQKPFILIIEDDKPLRTTLSRYLQATGYVVLQAASFGEALDHMSIRPALVVVDINLPDATGWDAVKWMQNVTRPVPVIVMSGVARPSPKQLEQAGAKAFLAKPFPIEELLRLVKQHAPLPNSAA